MYLWQSKDVFSSMTEAEDIIPNVFPTIGLSVDLIKYITYSFKYCCNNISSTFSWIGKHYVRLPILHLGQNEAKSQGASDPLLLAKLHQDTYFPPSPSELRHKGRTVLNKSSTTTFYAVLILCRRKVKQQIIICNAD